ncbi:hypothetical protein PILCRDRAFT_97458 [Piloderma croceum F 1598]|uniref:Protein kinase domain-containing protein n=1 Tax=Piloderma croceum (strain F 1598) TaxID=765440 RepID=A0A0C3FVT7_PILCF|nr:hypothetical protein PILCRDRAFT_97458 [Piloderma croceum F 1598]
MSNFHHFLVEHAIFPFPEPGEARSIGTTDISKIEVGLLETEQKAKYAKLCDTLQDILGNTVLSVDAENYLLTAFSPKLEVDEFAGVSYDNWLANPNKAHLVIVRQGILITVHKCLAVHGSHRFKTSKEDSVEGGCSKVDYIVLVDDEEKVLFEEKSPSVMKKLDEVLLVQGFKLQWIPSSSLVWRMLGKSTLYMGFRWMEWLFLSCHNYWVVCCLVKDDEHPFLVYSSIISVSIKPSTFGPRMELDTIIDEDDIDNGSGPYRGSSSKGTAQLRHGIKCSHNEGDESRLMCSGTRKPCLWLTHFVGFGSTGNDWQCHFDNSDDLYAVKIVELLCHSDAASCQQLHNEFKGDAMDVLILELCDSILREWDKLSAQVYKLVLALHSIGIMHGDLKPQNVACVHGGGFHLIDFSESRNHLCKESKVQHVITSLLIAANIGIDW